MRVSEGGDIVSTVAATFYQDALDLARLRVLPRGERLLVMDRVSGRWLTLDGGFADLLPLLGARARDLPEALRPRVGDLRQYLIDQQVGTWSSERRFGQLNTVILKLTNACNYACAYCYDFEKFEHSTTLDPELSTRALGQALDLVDSKLWVILHGGEPMLLWDELERIVCTGEQQARDRGKQIRFVGQTNLSRVNDRVVAFSRAHDIAWGVSIDGVPAVHDALRVTHTGEGTYVTFADAWRRYPSFVRGCGVMSTITAANQSRLLETCRHFRDLSMASWDWSLFQPIGRGRGQAHALSLDGDVLVAGWDDLFRAVESGEFDGFPVLPVKKYLDNFIAGPGGNMCMRGECGAGRDLLSISASGTIEACDCIDPTGPLAGLGDLRTTTLAEARESAVAHTIRGRDLTHTSCADCIWYGVCGGTCLAHSPSVDEVWPEACQLALHAFDRISSSLVSSTRLMDYVASVS